MHNKKTHGNGAVVNRQLVVDCIQKVGGTNVVTVKY